MGDETFANLLTSAFFTKYLKEKCSLKSNQFSFKVAVNVSRGEQTFPQIMADFSLFVH